MLNFQGYFGNLFEAMVITDFLKRFHHFGQMPSMYYLRTQDGLEIDLVVEFGQHLNLFEIKSAMTIFPKHTFPLLRISTELKSTVKTSAIISISPDNFIVKNEIYNYSWKNILGI
jgi:predicted AAA+ superfamily ATPase